MPWKMTREKVTKYEEEPDIEIDSIEEKYMKVRSQFEKAMEQKGTRRKIRKKKGRREGKEG